MDGYVYSPLVSLVVAFLLHTESLTVVGATFVMLTVSVLRDAWLGTLGRRGG